LLLAGVNIKAVSVRLGHAGIQITLDTYAHVLPEMEQQAAEAIGAAFRRAS
jgi:integrase